MITMQITVDIKEDRQVVLTLPPEVPMGQISLMVTVAPAAEKKKPRSSLAAWAEENAEDWGDRISSEDVEGFTGRRY